jgi:fucose permease
VLSHRDRRALQSVATQFFVNGAVVGSFLPRLPEIRDQIDTDVATIGLIFTLASLGGLLGSMVCSPFVERFGTKRAMVVGGLALIATLFVIGAAGTPAVFGVGLALLLLFDVVADVGMNMQGSAISSRRTIPVMNRLHGLWSLGTVLGGALAALLAAAEVDLQRHLVIVALALIATMLYVAPGLLDEADVLQNQRSAENDDDRPGPTRTTLTLLATFALLGAMAMVLEQTSGDWAALRLSDDLGQTAGVAGLGFVAYTLGMTTGRFSGDSVLGRIGEGQLVRGGATLNGIGLGIAFLVDTVPTVMIGLFLAGLGNSVIFPMLYDQAAKAPGRAGAGLGAMVGGARVGALIAPTAVGTMAATDVLSIGQAAAIVTIPCALTVIAVRLAQASGERGELSSA